MTENSETGFTKISNDLLEAIMQHKFSGLKLSVVLAVIRMTYGYQKTKSDLSVSFLTRMVDGSYNKVAEAVKCLIQDSVLTEHTPPGHSKKRVIGINKKYDKWSPPNG
jgi:phage replication O-like protein O